MTGANASWRRWEEEGDGVSFCRFLLLVCKARASAVRYTLGGLLLASSRRQWRRRLWRRRLWRRRREREREREMRGGEERRRGARRGERRRATLRAGAACMISIYGVDEDEEEGGGCVGAGACVRSRMEGEGGREGTAQTVGLPFACGVERVRVECESEQENSSAEEVLSGVDRRESSVVGRRS